MGKLFASTYVVLEQPVVLVNGSLTPNLNRFSVIEAVTHLPLVFVWEQRDKIISLNEFSVKKIQKFFHKFENFFVCRKNEIVFNSKTDFFQCFSQIFFNSCM